MSSFGGMCSSSWTSGAALERRRGADASLLWDGDGFCVSRPNHSRGRAVLDVAACRLSFISFM